MFERLLLDWVLDPKVWDPDYLDRDLPHSGGQVPVLFVFVFVFLELLLF